jgi:hypothetical protein
LSGVDRPVQLNRQLEPSRYRAFLIIGLKHHGTVQTADLICATNGMLSASRGIGSSKHLKSA